VFNWGQSWTLDEKGQIRSTGTPVIILGAYAFGLPSPWLATNYWLTKIVLPDVISVQ
jgi:hypothetical protein